MVGTVISVSCSSINTRSTWLCMHYHKYVVSHTRKHDDGDTTEDETRYTIHTRSVPPTLILNWLTDYELHSLIVSHFPFRLHFFPSCCGCFLNNFGHKRTKDIHRVGSIGHQFSLVPNVQHGSFGWETSQVRGWQRRAALPCQVVLQVLLVFWVFMCRRRIHVPHIVRDTIHGKYGLGPFMLSDLAVRFGPCLCLETTCEYIAIVIGMLRSRRIRCCYFDDDVVVVVIEEGRIEETSK